MGTANFRTMDYDLPLVIGGVYDSDTIEHWKNEYRAEYGEEMTERELEYEFQMYAEDDFAAATKLAEDFNESLQFYKMEVIGGYYEGFQFFVSGIWFDDYEEMDNDDAHYYFNMCRSKALRAEKSEMRKIEKWLQKITSEYGYDMIMCVGRFSNGEAAYRKVG